MSLGDLMMRVFRRIDLVVAREVERGVLEPRTALAVFGVIRDEVRSADPHFAEQLVPRATEDAAARIAATALTTQLTKGTHDHSPEDC